MQSADGASALNARLRLQLRGTLTRDDATELGFTPKTVRLILRGHALTPRFRYAVQLGFGTGDISTTSPVSLFDAYVEYALARDLCLRAGQYYVPFDRARTIRDSDIRLVERAQVVSELNLDRDAGITLFSEDLGGAGGKLAYFIGVFGGDGRNHVELERPRFLYVARLAVRPFGPFDDDSDGDLERLARPRLALGVAAAYNHGAIRQKSTTGGSLDLGGFDYVHAAADLVAKYRGASLLAEVLYRHASADSHEAIVDGETVREWSRSGWGYLVEASLMAWRRLELAARWNQLFAAQGTDPAFLDSAHGRGKEIGGGITYYFNGHALKIQADYGARFGSKRASHAAHVQLEATF